jgi:hypothetical protein
MNKVFAEGMYFNERNEKMPEWLLGKISIKRDKLIPFLQAQKETNGYINLDIKMGKSGKPYLELNTFQPKKQTVSADDLNDMFGGEVRNPDTGGVVPF